MHSIAKSISSVKPFYILLIIAFVMIGMTFFSSSAKASSCPQIPAVSWWGDTSAEKLTAYVDRKHDGDWTPYIKKWELYADRMRQAMFSGEAVKIKFRNVVLDEGDLAVYIRQVGERVEATRCIADEVIDARLIEELATMDTAAGGNPELEIRLVE
jgi:hypothetical protein